MALPSARSGPAGCGGSGLWLSRRHPPAGAAPYRNAGAESGARAASAGRGPQRDQGDQALRRPQGKAPGHGRSSNGWRARARGIGCRHRVGSVSGALQERPAISAGRPRTSTPRMTSSGPQAQGQRHARFKDRGFKGRYRLRRLFARDEQGPGALREPAVDTGSGGSVNGPTGTATTKRRRKRALAWALMCQVRRLYVQLGVGDGATPGVDMRGLGLWFG